MNTSMETLEQPSEPKKATAGIITIEEGGLEVLPCRERYQQPMPHNRVSLSTLEHQSDSQKVRADAVPIENEGIRRACENTEPELKTRVSLMALEQNTGLEKARRSYATHPVLEGHQQERCAALPSVQQATKTRFSLVSLEMPSESRTTSSGTDAVQKFRTSSEVFSDQQPDNASVSLDRVQTLRTELVSIQEESHISVMIPDQEDENAPRSLQEQSFSRRSLRSPASGLSNNNLDSASVVGSSMLTFPTTLPPTHFNTWRWKFGMVTTALIGVVIIGCIVALLVTMKHKDGTVPIDGNVVVTATPPVESTYLQEFQDLLMGSEEQFLRPGSPQWQATFWLATVDEPRMNLSAANLKQRYALMVLWYAHGGMDWKDQNAWALSGVHECEWKFLSCNSNHEVLEIVMGEGMPLTGSLVSEIGLLSSLGEHGLNGDDCNYVVGFSRLPC